jgi:hypothetical protein
MIIDHSNGKMNSHKQLTRINYADTISPIPPTSSKMNNKKSKNKKEKKRKNIQIWYNGK